MNVPSDTPNMTFDPTFRAKMKTAFSSGQTKFDQEVARVTEPYVPKLSGVLSASVFTASKFGSGELIWNTPYAASQYYLNKQAGSQTGALRGPRWGDRAKSDNLKTLQAYAVKVTVGGLV